MGAEDVKTMARQLGVKVEEVVEMETRLGGHDVALEPLAEDEDNAFSPISYLTAEDAEPGRLLEQEETARLRSTGLKKAMGSLDARSRRIIEARWLDEKNPATLHDLAGEFGVSAERIRQIEHKALAKMKGAIAASA
jgi:RNA polymerase sigma-32 factor